MKNRLTEAQYYRYHTLIANICGNDPVNAEAVYKQFVTNRNLESKRWKNRSLRSVECWTFGDVIVACLLRDYERHGDNLNWRGFKYSQTRSTNKHHRRAYSYNNQTCDFEPREPRVAQPISSQTPTEQTPPYGSIAVIIRPATGDFEQDKTMSCKLKDNELTSVSVSDVYGAYGVWQAIFFGLQKRNKEKRKFQEDFLRFQGYSWP